MSTMTDNETYNEASGTPDGHMNESNTDSFNGYKNRETWAFNLHWQNDRGLYNLVCEWGAQWADMSDWQLGRSVIDAVEDVWETGGALMPLREVGSFWRIDEAEVGAAVRESLDNES